MTEIPLAACLATEIFEITDVMVLRGGYWLEAKQDGHRVLIDYRGHTPKILNRNGRPYSAGPFRLDVPELFRGMVIDGEYMPQDQEFWAFDLLKDDGDTDLCYERPYYERTHRLASIIQALNDQDDRWPGWRYDGYHMLTAGNISSLRRLAETGRRKIDGVVLKRKASVYVPGRSSDWLKYKFTNTVDAFLTRLNIDDKANAAVAVSDPEGRVFEIGKVSTAGRRVQVNSVVTVRFLKFTEGLRLREPRIVDVRDDKAPRECGVEQLIPYVPSLAQTQE